MSTGPGGWFGPVEGGPSNADHPDELIASDEGRALLEVIFLAVLLLIPVVYILISVLRLQAATFAVTQAARDAGRAIDSSVDLAQGVTRAREIAALDLQDQNIPDGRLRLEFYPAGSGCTGGAQVPPSLDGGATFDVCVTAVLTLPGVPTVLTGSDNTISGVYTVHIGDLREAR